MKNMSLSSGISEYLLYHSYELASREKTVLWHKKNFDSFTAYMSTFYPADKEIPLSQFNDFNVRSYLLSRVKNDKVSMRTVLNHWQSFKAFCRFLLTREYIDKDIMLKVTRPKVERKLPDALNENQVKELVKYMLSRRKRRYRMNYLRDLALIGCFLFAGLRRSEAMNLTINDIDLASHVIKLQRTKSRRVEQMPINKTLYPLLANYIQVRLTLKRNTDKLFVACNRGNTDDRRRGDGSFGTRGLQLLLGEINHNTVTTIGKKIYPHLLRRTFGSTLLRHGVNIVSVSRLLRHSDISVTCRSYIEWNSGELATAIEKCNVSIA